MKKTQQCSPIILQNPVWKKIDRSCNYTYPEGANFETEYGTGSLDHSIAIMQYKSNPTQKNRKKIQEPLFSKSCLKLIRAHIKDFNSFAE